MQGPLAGGQRGKAGSSAVKVLQIPESLPLHTPVFSKPFSMGKKGIGDGRVFFRLASFRKLFRPTGRLPEYRSQHESLR